MTATMERPEAGTREICAADRVRCYDLTSALLTYPDADLIDATYRIADSAASLRHDGLRALFVDFLTWFSATPAEEIERHYVATFDLRRRSGLYLTYYLHGDTRKRGLALLTLKNRYRAHGLRLAKGELPDLLPVVLEFAAAVGPGDGEAPLRQHRRGLELLRSSLSQAGSPYALLLDAIGTVLPPLTEADRAAVAALAQDGPPAESVGLAPDGQSVPVPGNELAGLGHGPALDHVAAGRTGCSHTTEEHR